MLVICGRYDLGEEYLAELVNASRDRVHPGVNPIVKVLRVMRYPQQHAIYWPDVAIEIPPIREGAYVRLEVHRPATEDEARRFRTYADSLRWAQEHALDRAETEAEREILRRHLAGEYRRQRKARYFSAWELVKRMEEAEPGGND